MDIEPSHDLRPKVIQDTVRLPGLRGEAIHIELSNGRAAATFEAYVRGLGLKYPEGAKDFFERNIEISFVPVNVAVKSNLSGLDLVLTRLTEKLEKGTNGYVLPKKDGKYILGINPLAIAENLPLIARNLNVNDYNNLPDEQKIALFRRAIQSTLKHEYYHLYQEMIVPGRINRSFQNQRLSQRLLLVLASVSPAMYAVLPPEQRFTIIPTIMGLQAVRFFLSRGMIKLENEADSMETKGLPENLPNPFTITYEQDTLSS